MAQVPDAEYEALLGRPHPGGQAPHRPEHDAGRAGTTAAARCAGWSGLVLHTLLNRSSREETPDLNMLFQYNMPLRALATDDQRRHRAWAWWTAS